VVHNQIQQEDDGLTLITYCMTLSVKCKTIKHPLLSTIYNYRYEATRNSIGN